MRKYIFLYLIGPFLFTQAFSQDIHFSQYYVAPQLINPSSFGVLNSFEAGLQYKGQWNAFTNGYTSYAAFANKSFKSKNDPTASKAYSSVGLNVIYDKAGSNNLTHFKAEIPVNVTKRISSTSFLTTGLYAGFGQLGAKSDNFTWGNQFDGAQYNSALNSNETNFLQTKNYWDCGAGITHVLLRRGREEKDMALPQNVIAFSVAHLNRPDYGINGAVDAPLGMRFNFYEQYYLNFRNSDISLVPSIMVQYQTKTYEVIFGTLVKKAFKDGDTKKTKYFSVGAFYRLQDMCALTCMVELNKYTLGLNYDFNVSKLMTTSRSFGGLEISLRMNTPFQHAFKSAGNIKGTLP